MWRPTKPSSPIIEPGNYHEASYFDLVWFKHLGFNASENIRATDTAENALSDKNITNDVLIEGSARADRLKEVPAARVLLMAYFYADVKRGKSHHTTQAVSILEVWASSLTGKVKNIIDDFDKLCRELDQNEHQYHVVVRPLGTELIRILELEPTYLLASMIARRIGYKPRHNEGGGGQFRESLLRPLVWVGFWLVLIVQCSTTLLTLQATRNKLVERFRANRRDYDDWYTGNRMAYEGMTQWLERNIASPSHVAMSGPPTRIQVLADGFACLGSIVIENYFDHSKDFRVWYNELSTSYFLVGEDSERVMCKLAGIKYDEAGGRVSSSAFSLVLVWAYILLVVTISVLVIIRNWGGRNSPFERLSDGVWVATTGLVSVFGLMKLTSEDPNAIRHALSVRTVLTNARDIFLHLDPPVVPSGVSWEDYLKICSAALPVPVEWAKKEHTSFIIEQIEGNIRIPDGVQASRLALALVFADEKSLIRCGIANETPFKVENVVGNFHRLTGERLGNDARPKCTGNWVNVRFR